MHKLMVPIDGSDNSTRALQYALKMAKEVGPMQLHLLTVHPEPAVYGEIQVYVTAEKMKEMQDLRSMDLLQPAIDAAKSAGVSFESEIATGDPAGTIAKLADERHCDAIVMGTRGMSAIANLMMGSVATKVVHFSTMPVTLVK
jgi:nucleotide-binding universal stress UspA family protein